MPTGAIGHEIEITRARGVGGRFQRGTPRIGDRARRQSLNDVGVVRRRLLDLAALDRPSERTLAADKAVDDGRIGLQLDLLAQPVDEHRSDAAALIGAAGFLLNDRSQRHKLIGGAQREIGIAMLPDFREQPLLRLLHALDHLLARGAARKLVSVRQQRALARHFAQRAREDVVILQPLNDLFRCQPFRNGEGMLHHLAIDDGADDIRQACILLEQEFARFERGARVERQHAADKGPAIRLDDTLSQQDVANVGHPRAWRNIDDLVGGQRTFRGQHLLAVDVKTARAEDHHQQNRDDGVARNHEGIASAVGTLRRRNLLRL
ncbi:hypothetical protein BN961_01681 [Afipia felis]|uniref:Uncharacterized protein n=1 Tax=Afipia felis TaxID=1035 RepID=A0A090MPS7_AFIFE|nr:hypothetical protein BN961_01681 [Afipia felis]